jgi:hypothetical protein
VRAPRRLVCLFVAAAGAAAAPLAAALHCDSTTALTVVGIDTRGERVVFAIPGEGDGPAWLVEADFAGRAARAWPDPREARRFAGSNGPGAVLAATRCGAKCLQVVRFGEGAWKPLGEPLLASEATTVHLTWDRAGAAWLVLHAFAGGGAASATAYRLEGGDWVSKGGQSVHAVGNPGAGPAPPGEEGITSGDSQFSAAAKPRRWLDALPQGTRSAGGQLVWLGGKAAAYLGTDGTLSTTADGGTTWQPPRWQPWSRGEGDLAWRAGRDYSFELPDGERADPFGALWNDRHVTDKPMLYLAARSAEGSWRSLAATPPGILTEAGDRLGYNHILRFAGERWVLATGCVARQGGAALAFRRYANGTLGAPELLRVAVAGP